MEIREIILNKVKYDISNHVYLLALQSHLFLIHFSTDLSHFYSLI